MVYRTVAEDSGHPRTMARAARHHGGNIDEVAQRYGLNARQIIDFSTNVNPFGPPPSVLETLQDNLWRVSVYPDLSQKKLKEALADYLSVDSSQIIPGNGSAELIYLVASYLSPKKTIIPIPSFCEYPLAIQAFGGEPIFIPLTQNFQMDLKEILRHLSQAQMLIIANPNNPTGNLFDMDDLLKILQESYRHNVLMMVDEAFVDFVPHRDSVSLVRKVGQFRNLIVLGSLTKFFALPGLRLGYLVAHPELVADLSRRIPPWNVNSLAQLGGPLVLQDYQFQEESRARIIENREYLAQKLASVGSFRTHPSVTNFILAEILGGSITATKLWEFLAKKGILIRDCSSFLGLGPAYVRLAVRKREEIDRLTEVLKGLSL
ncbi:MAG: Threonine-phosphate decarboxylase [Actinobacteria bacterium]|nr:Threonine-phosphate decarboxylase [Actinomycetota bacterium]